MKFDADGNLLASWGGRSPASWMKNEHGIHVDAATATSGSAATTTATRF